MRSAGSLKAMASAIAAAAVMLSVSLTATAAQAAAIPRPAPLPGTATTAPATTTPATTKPAAPAPPRPVSHPATTVCGAAAKPGLAACLSEKRTDVRAHKGVFAATAGEKKPPAALAANPADSPQGYGPADLQSAYELPSASAGSGATVAIVDAFDDPGAEADLAVYRQQYGLAPCTSASGCFTQVAQDGTTNLPGQDPTGGWEEEESLDLDMVSAVCPNCNILLVESKDNSFVNLGTAENEAVTLGAQYVSDSWGGSEDPSDLTLNTQYFQHPGVAITAATGDSGYGAQYPASSPYVTAVGGTTLVPDTGASRGWDESAWDGGGSGCSSVEPKPSWQTDTGCPDRTDADVSAVADPDTGVAVYDSEIGGWAVFGGTSVAAPVIASVYALAGSPLAGTYPGAYPYNDPSALNDVTTGSNGSCGPAYLCTAGPGYDGPTGLGTPDGVVAFAGVQQGTIYGYVEDATTGQGLAGAQVTAGSATATADATGLYSLSLPVGTYTATASDFGYTPHTDSGIEVTFNGTTNDNFYLNALPSTTLTGQVADGSGQGWPLYAKISIPGSSVVTYTNPATGQYSLTVPQNQSFTVQADVVETGYQPLQQTAQIAASPATVNFSVPVNAEDCTAAGYSPSDVGAVQTFDGTTAPPGWSVTSPGRDSFTSWFFDGRPLDLPNNTGGSGNYADVEPDGDPTDIAMVSPVFDFSQDPSPVVRFATDLQEPTGPPNSSELVQVSTDGGSTWTTVSSMTGMDSQPGPATDTIPLPMAAGQSHVQIRWWYLDLDSAGSSDYWEVDNAFIGHQDCLPDPGGLAEGQVLDGNTGAGVSGAEVTSAATGRTVVTQTTPGDPVVNGGFWDTFVPAADAGRQKFTAQMTGYTTTTVTQTVTSGAVSTVNITLPAGQITASPADVSASARLGNSTTKKVKFTNTGTATATFTLSQQPGGFTSLPLGAQQDASPAGAPLQLIPGNYSPLSPAKAMAAAKSQPKRAVTAPPGAAAKPAAAAPSDWPWVTLADYPEPVTDNAMATDPATGIVYSVGGSNNLYSGPDGPNVVTDVFAYNPQTQQWSTLPHIPGQKDAAQAAFIGGKLYVTGGWDGTGIPDPATYIYDPATRAWTTGAPDPDPLAGAGLAVLNSKMYIVGGCDEYLCAHTDVEVYNPATDTWSADAGYPVQISWESCGAITGKIYCAGGAGLTFFATPTGYVYDPSANTWSPIASLPVQYGLWASAYTSADGELLVSGGVLEAKLDKNDVLTNQGFAYSPVTNSWTTLPNSDVAEYRGGSSCGLYQVGGIAGANSDPQPAAQLLPGYGICGSEQVPWLTESLTTYTLKPGKSITVTLTLNAGDASITQLGTYTASLAVGTTTPQAVSPVGITLDVEPPATWGEISGTVTGLACTGTVPLAGATVQIGGAVSDYTLLTDASGFYGLWLDTENNPLTVIAADNGWQPQVTTVKIKRLATTTQNFALAPDTPCNS